MLVQYDDTELTIEGPLTLEAAIACLAEREDYADFLDEKTKSEAPTLKWNVAVAVDGMLVTSPTLPISDASVLEFFVQLSGG